MALQITNQADYALRSMLYIAPFGSGNPIPTKIIADEMQISRAFLSRINQQLCASGLIKTRRGVKGGVMLARPAAEISVYDILRAIDGEITLIRCTRDSQSCPISHICGFMEFWQACESSLIEKLKGTSLQVIVENKPPL